MDVAKGGSFVFGLSVFAAIMYRLTGDDDVVVLTDDTKNPFIIRLSLTPTLTFTELQALVQAEYSKCASNVDYKDLREVAENIQNASQLDHLPGLFRVSYQHKTPTATLNSPVPGSVRDLAIYTTDSTLTIFYNSLLYKSERISVLGEQIAQFSAAVAKDPSVPITHVSLVTPSQKAQLPDPTNDLDWAGYRGAIQDIFMENAGKHPDRPCVVETKSFMDPSTKTRTFTYKQINQASNIVGNYLKATGIKKGDIVMIYSYRGVDLMIAVMGILKAGATFSVIDPAYPPARQNIYLSVAKPRGLIVLEKAGSLDSLVTDYIRDELQVITQIPLLRINDDGSLVGGAASNSADDVLAAYDQYKDTPTGVIVGPDSNPTLSFTSGSEGIPKGVLGRHYSLAYYFPWMASKFGLSSDDRFTMLSGIAHDPIQRDMFTPLFLGAQLLVPTADDIGTPGKLADWMAEYGATVTHLTPAMGQLLSAQATTPIPTLHHAFFVGDILTKRDCLRLQTLAANVYIVNMYGTTETQRSVSYFEIKSRAADADYLRNLKDVMPAGTGMHNVQLLVVNRSDRTQTCGVGEVGEIYVRAAGLAEGYRGLPDLNAEKFITNWFVPKGLWPDKGAGAPWSEHGWLGPRDRMYRTGDLGRYLPDGNVECCGRADDQVKIRGFRIELGEIDTHMSQHALVRENITLVRKDRNGDPTLISFIVPKPGKELEALTSDVDASVTDSVVRGLVAYRTLIKDIRAYLKKRLASYAIPTVILPMGQLPLNPNGKVDKPKLPFPTPEQLAQVAQFSQDGTDEVLTPTETLVRDLWLDVLPNRPASISKTDSFFDLGGHSILGTRMIFELRKRTSIDVPLGVIFKHPTLEAFAKAVDDTHAPGASSTSGQLPSADYAKDAEHLVQTALLPSYPSRDGLDAATTTNVFVTGVTGFLGAFLVRDILAARPSKPFKVFAHVRAANKEAGKERIRRAGVAYGIWDDAWASQIEVVLGDLSKAQFGLADSEWTRLADTIDVVIHNGALVHWVYPYAKLRDANVIGTINVMNLCGVGKAKHFSFVSSTSAIDTNHFFEMSDALVAAGKAGVPEDDDLQGSATGLGTGYGQSKWAAEYIVRAAGRRGLKGCITRPGYVTGFSKTGASNTDDFLLRMLKGSIEVGAFPEIANNVNMVPVDHVARVVVATAFHPPVKTELAVAHVTGHPRIAFTDFLDTSVFGYDVKRAAYPQWKQLLEKYVTSGKESALFPLLHYVLDDLPQDTKAPELYDTHAAASLAADAKWTGEDVSSGKGVDARQLAIYVSYLVKTGFLPLPRNGGASLPEIDLSKETLELISTGASGRSSAA